MEIWVAGYPSFCGGADSELDHNIDLWRMYGVDVHLVPTGGCDPRMRSLCDARGCITHEYTPEIFNDKIVASFCNGQFLSRLPEIMDKGKPALVVWFNCMTWTFQSEIDAIKNGWIDLHGFVSKYQRSILKPQLEGQSGKKIHELEGYRPYFNPDSASQRIVFDYRPPADYFGMGRISRDDGAKYSPDMWRIFDRVCSPRPTKTFILGYGENAAKKTGPAPATLDWQTWSPAGIPVAEFYSKLHVLIHKTGGSRESYCRVVPEAYASGIPVIVENDYAFPELVIQGETGFLCGTSDAMSFAASVLAFNEDQRKKIAVRAREFLVNEIANIERCFNPWSNIL